jgi:hypothetical protein
MPIFNSMQKTFISTFGHTSRKVRRQCQHRTCFEQAYESSREMRAESATKAKNEAIDSSTFRPRFNAI